MLPRSRHGPGAPARGAFCLPRLLPLFRLPGAGSRASRACRRKAWMNDITHLHATFPELVAFEAYAQQDATVLGVLYAGSQGRGDFDRFSDLDIKVWLGEGKAQGPGRPEGAIAEGGEVPLGR